MGENARLIILLIWLPQALSQIFNWLYWWQVKEYRLDRFLIFFKSKTGIKELEILKISSKIFLLLLSLLYQPLIFYAYALFIFLDIKFFYFLLSKGGRRPIFTNRALNVLLTIIIFVFVIFIANFETLAVNQGLTLFLLELALLVSLFFGLVWTALLVRIIKRFEIEKAQIALKRVKPVVIGVTGSYGKTATKDFIAHLLSQKYKNAKTTGSENTELGIARKTVKFIKKGVKYFVVEMGAYKKGEIKSLTEITKPRIGVITGIELQHLELFGSLENIKSAKFELIEELPKKGTAIFNLSNKYCRELYQKSKKLPSLLKVLGYILSDSSTKKIKSDLTAKIINQKIDSVEFEFVYKGTKKKLCAPFAGIHFVENLAGAVLVARELGVTWRQIERAIKSISLPEKTMQVKKIEGGSYLIDDTFNATPKGFEAALKYLNIFNEQKKIVITPGIIELGKESSKTHKWLGELLAKYADFVVLTSSDFIDEMKTGMGASSTKLKLNKNPRQITDLISKEGEKYAVLLEGRIPAKIYKALT